MSRPNKPAARSRKRLPEESGNQKITANNHSEYYGRKLRLDQAVRFQSLKIPEKRAVDEGKSSCYSNENSDELKQ